MGTITPRVDELLREREGREGRRLPLADIAQASGIPLETLAELIARRADTISLSALARLCDFFHCTVDEVLHYDGDPLLHDVDEVESRDIVARWEQVYGVDEHPPETSR
jgi:DNA-binding Xre family transcriptional regulator